MKFLRCTSFQAISLSINYSHSIPFFRGIILLPTCLLFRIATTLRANSQCNGRAWERDRNRPHSHESACLSARPHSSYELVMKWLLIMNCIMNWSYLLTTLQLRKVIADIQTCIKSGKTLNFLKFQWTRNKPEWFLISNKNNCSRASTEFSRYFLLRGR